MTFAASALAELETLFGAEAVQALGQGDGNRLYTVLGLVSWSALLVDRGEPDAVVAGARARRTSARRDGGTAVTVLFALTVAAGMGR